MFVSSFLRFVRSPAFPLSKKTLPSLSAIRSIGPKWHSFLSAERGQQYLDKSESTGRLTQFVRAHEASMKSQSPVPPAAKRNSEALQKKLTLAAALQEASQSVDASVTKFIQERTNDLKAAVIAMQNNGGDPHSALATATQAQGLSPERAVLLEDALARYIIDPNLSRAVHQGPQYHAPQGLDEFDVIKIQNASKVAVQAMADSVPETKDKTSHEGTLTRSPSVTIFETQIASDSVAPSTTTLSTSPTTLKSAPLPSPPATDKSHSAPSSVVFATTHQSNQLYREKGGGTACTFMSLEAIDIFGGKISSVIDKNSMDSVLNEGANARLDFHKKAKAEGKSDDLESTPVTGPIITDKGYRQIDLFPGLQSAFGYHIDGHIPQSHVEIAANKLIADGKTSVITAGAYSFALIFNGDDVTVFNSHGDPSEFKQQPELAAYAATFSDKKEATKFLRNLLASYTGGLHQDEDALEVYQ